MKSNIKNRRGIRSVYAEREEQAITGEVRKGKILIALVLIIICCNCLPPLRPTYGFFSQEAREPLVTPEETRYFWLSGQVSEEGLYDLSAGIPEIDLAEVQGLSTLHFSDKEGVGLQSITPLAAVVFFKPLPLNLVNTQELTALPQVGPVLAGRIVAERQELSGFTKLEQLLRVPGIGAVTYQRLCHLLTVEIAPQP